MEVAEKGLSQLTSKYSPIRPPWPSISRPAHSILGDSFNNLQELKDRILSSIFLLHDSTWRTGRERRGCQSSPFALAPAPLANTPLPIGANIFRTPSLLCTRRQCCGDMVIQIPARCTALSIPELLEAMLPTVDIPFSRPTFPLSTPSLPAPSGHHVDPVASTDCLS